MPRFSSRSDDEFHISKPEQIKALASPRRQELLDRLTASGPMTVAQLARQSGLNVHGLYYHLKLLCSVGLVTVEPGAGRRRDTLYAARAKRIMLRHAFPVPANRAALNQVAAAAAEQMRADYAAALEAGGFEHDGPARTLSLLRLLGRPTPDQLGEINACLERILDIMSSTASEDGPPTLSIGWIMAPLKREQPD